MNENLDSLEEYKKAFYYLLEYWDSFNKDQQKGINEDLNQIFKINVSERIEK